MRVRTNLEFADDVSYMVSCYLARGPETIRQAYKSVIACAAKEYVNESDNWEVALLVDDGLPFGFCLDNKLSLGEAQEIVVTALRDYEVQKLVIAKVKSQLAVNGHEVDWEG